MKNFLEKQLKSMRFFGKNTLINILNSVLKISDKGRAAPHGRLNVKIQSSSYATVHYFH